MNPYSSSKVQYLTIDAEFAEQRIDNYLLTHLKGVPRTHIYRILRKGEIRINKKRIDPSYRLQAGDILRLPPIRLSEKKPVTPGQSLIALLKARILYEDKQLLIINKPSGIAVHAGSGVKLGLVEALKTLYPHSPQLELAHRLDADTSGCLILAKRRSVLRELHELMRNGSITKIYWALTKGHWQSTDLRVDVPLLKNQVQGGERIVKVAKEGKTSLTLFKPLKTYTNASLVEAALHTGRTHQIRVHAQYKKHPVAGDEKYGDKLFNKQMRQLGLKRMFLHAYLLDFILPSTGQTVRVQAPLDKDLQECLDMLS
ncbi:23S rRNA pseudouridylate synthase [Gammaproteobacteria bacterium SCGC AG-212-F23]|nr:23S rRNA pseudouridylate synthase [Gammaproteobacteria bacterium SCGC AG-212-F23]